MVRRLEQAPEDLNSKPLMIADICITPRNETLGNNTIVGKPDYENRDKEQKASIWTETTIEPELPGRMKKDIAHKALVRD